MNDISYIGEHLWVGQLGHFAIILGFVTALLSAYSYFKSTRNFSDEALSKSWKLLGRYSFAVHGLMIITLISVLFFAMYNHYYEYSYVFAHVCEELPLKYILSAFWEGQEGSFLLWMFWHIVLSVFVIRTSGKFEAPVMFTFAIAEAILVSMILGILI
ncbi:MAG TPA: cytochrome c assembly protein, partial [Saprospiraceae bacterium]|nr:cytochrome c assembly protein [Saprospiraceae bacterium]